MGDEQGVERPPLSDADLFRIGRAFSEAHVVSSRCASCGVPYPVSDGVHRVASRVFAAGYRLRDLGPEGCSEWLAHLDGPGEVGSVEGPLCRLGLRGGRHAFTSTDGRSWICLCGSQIVGTKVVFAWPGSPLDGQAHVVTDAQLEEFLQEGVVAAEVPELRVPV